MEVVFRAWLALGRLDVLVALVALVISVVLGVGGVAQGRPALDAHRLGQLTHYEVLLFSDPLPAGLLRHKAIGLFDYPAEAVFRVATHYDRFGDYIPHVETRVLSQRGSETVVLVRAEMPWPISMVWVEARYTQDPPSPSGETYRVRFAMVRGNMRRYEGSLLIEPFGKGRSTVTYELLAEPDSHLPRSLVQRALGRTATSFVNYLRSRVNSLQRQAAARAAQPAASGTR